MAFAAGNRLFGRPAGAFAAAILASSPLYVLLGQINTLDMSVSLFLSAAVFAFALAQREAVDLPARRRWMLAFWAACAGAVLSKGLIGIVLPVGAVGLYVLVRRDWALLLRLELVRGGLLFLALTAPWFVAVSLANPEFAHFFFVQEHWLRFTPRCTTARSRAWYFIPVLVAGVWPWLLAMTRRLGGRVAPPARRGVLAGAVPRPVGAGGVRFLFRLGLEAAAVHPAAGSGARRARRRLLARRTGNSLLVAQALLASAGRDPARCRGLVAVARSDELRGLDAAAFVPGSSRRRWSGSPAAAPRRCWRRAAVRCAPAISLAAGVLGSLMVGAAGHPVFAPAYSAASLVASLPQAPSRDAAVFTVETYDHTIPWALRRTVTMVGYKDELEQAIALGAARLHPRSHRFCARLEGRARGLRLFAVRDFERLRRELGLPMEIAARGPRYVLVRKP